MARYERFSMPPRAVSLPSPEPRISMVDRQIAALRMERENNERAMKTREELYQDLTDFSYIDQVDEYGFPIRTAYQIPDSLPDVLPMPKTDAPKTSEKDEPEVAPSA